MGIYDEINNSISFGGTMPDNPENYYNNLAESHPKRGFTWRRFEDVIYEAELMSHLLPFLDRDNFKDVSLDDANIYIEAFIDHAADSEIIALYEFLKIHAIMQQRDYFA